jgi:hypothetical protein
LSVVIKTREILKIQLKFSFKMVLEKERFQYDKNCNLPFILKHSTMILIENDRIKTFGIFRISAKKSEIQKLREIYQKKDSLLIKDEEKLLNSLRDNKTSKKTLKF